MADAHLQSAIQVHLQHALISTSRPVSISLGWVRTHPRQLQQRRDGVPGRWPLATVQGRRFVFTYDSPTVATMPHPGSADVRTIAPLSEGTEGADHDIVAGMGHERASTTLNLYAHRPDDRDQLIRGVFDDFSLSSEPNNTAKYTGAPSVEGF
jgi:hypothetical protein